MSQGYINTKIQNLEALILKMQGDISTILSSQLETQASIEQQLTDRQLEEIHAVPHYKHVHNSLHNEDDSTITPNVTPSVNVYYTPLQIQTAYGLNLIHPSDSSLLGHGIKVAVIIAYHYPGLQADFNAYNTHFGLPAATLQITTLGSRQDSGWALEECLDIQTIHSIAPGATIIVVEAATSSLTDLGTAIARAKTLGADVINMSWGSSEFSSQTTFDSIFSGSNICYCASSGDSNSVSYPSVSNNILSIGGSTLTLNNSNLRTSETTWSSAGCGISRYITKASWQNSVNTHATRQSPDICAVANPATGFIVRWNSQYYVVGGTSLSSPLVCGILAVANQLRVLVSKPKLSTVLTATTPVQKYLYQTILPNNSLYATDLYDITSGRDGIFTTGVKYDIATGVGAPKANSLCAQLVNL